LPPGNAGKQDLPISTHIATISAIADMFTASKKADKHFGWNLILIKLMLDSVFD